MTTNRSHFMQTIMSDRPRTAWWQCRVFPRAATILLWGAVTVVADPPNPAHIMLQPAMSEPSVSLGVEVTLIAANHGGTGPYTYLWRHNGQELAVAEAVGSRLKLGAVELGDAGEYTVLVRGADGEALSRPFTLGVDRRFQKVALPESTTAMTAAWGDLNGDGWLDVVTAHAGHLRVHINARDGTLPMRQDLPISSQEFRKVVTLGDFDNDGLPDLLMSENWEDRVRIFRNAGAGTLLNKETLEVANCVSPSWVDLDADGYLDLFVMRGNPGTIPAHVYMNEAGASF